MQCLMLEKDPLTLGEKFGTEYRWITNDGRYTEWDFPTNPLLTILSKPEELDDGRSFYVAGFLNTSGTQEVFSLGGVWPLQGTNPILQYIHLQIEKESFTNQNVLQGELVATRSLVLSGDTHILGTSTDIKNTTAETIATATNAVRVIAPQNPNQDNFQNSNTICGYYIMNSPILPTIMQLPAEETNTTTTSSTITSTTNDSSEKLPGLLVGSADFLTNNAAQGYETNHLITRLDWNLFSPVTAPAEANCKDAPLVNTGTTNAPVMIYQFDASGDYKITAADLYPLTLKTGAVVNLVLPENYVLAEPAVTMESGSQLVLFPKGNLTLGAKSFASVEKNFERLTLWGGTNNSQLLTFSGSTNTVLCGRVYAPYSQIILTNNLYFSGAMIGGKITMEPGTFFFGNTNATYTALPGTTGITNYFLKVKKWERMQETQDDEEEN